MALRSYTAAMEDLHPIDEWPDPSTSLWRAEVASTITKLRGGIFAGSKGHRERPAASPFYKPLARRSCINKLKKLENICAGSKDHRERPAAGGQRTFGEELGVGAALDDGAAFDDGYLRGGLHGGEAVRDDYDGAAGLHALEGLLHQRLALRVQRARRLPSDDAVHHV